MEHIWKLMAAIAIAAGIVACNKGPVAVESISLDKDEIEIGVGKTELLSVIVHPENAEKVAVTWSSSDPSVATVSDGTVTGVKLGNATITAVAEGFSAECAVTVFYDAPAVDLGLSVKWASYNVGAQKEDEPGSYFAWGEVSEKGNYAWERDGEYKWGTCNPATGPLFGLKKYTAGAAGGDGLKTLQADDDPATVIWGGRWRTPTKDEINELITKCEWTWDPDKKGYTVKGAKTGNTIFLPTAGFRAREDTYRVGMYGYYWSSSVDESDIRFACNFDFSKDGQTFGNDYRFYGQSIRAVIAY